MTEYKPKTIGTLYTVTINDCVLAHKNGNPKLFSTWSKASKTAKKLGDGAKVVPVCLSIPEAVKPIEIAPSDVAKVLREIANQYDTGLPRTAIFDLQSDIHTNILRFTPLGTKPVVQQGDTDMVYELYLKWRCDVANGRDEKL